MNSTRHERVMQVLGEAIELQPAGRSAFLDSACADDPEMRREVERLLAAEAEAGEVFDKEGGARKWVESITQMVKPESELKHDPALLGTRLGAYEFQEFLGRGGMGVVYRAMDTRLQRPVAIKALPRSLTNDPSRLARFTREARILASLSHPNIATVYGLEESPTGKFLVMELIEGDTLSDCLADGPLGIARSLEIARQIAAGLSEAHDADVVHRDIKPANIMCGPDGDVKVLDFGLAREIVHENGTRDDITREGSIVGTPRYMSPEQLRGQGVDRRSDVFAFGSVLYECLCGSPAFQGKSSADIVLAVIDHEPDWSALPARMPESIVRLLHRCLAKDPERRLRDLGDARLEIEDALTTRGWTTASATSKRASVYWPLAIGAIIAVIALGISFWKNRAPAPVVSEAPLERFALRFPNNAIQTSPARLRVALSRDGNQMAISASDGKAQQLFLRRRGDVDFQPVEGTVKAWVPTFSPDGQWLAYFDAGKMVKRRTAGGSPIPILDAFGYWSTYSWDIDDQITYMLVWGKGVARVSANGGTPSFVTNVEHRDADFAHLLPSVTPDNRTIIFSVWNGKEDTRVDACNLDGSNRHTIIEQGGGGRVVQTPRGSYLLFARHGTIYASRFDLDKQQCTGTETALAYGILTDRSFFSPAFDVADDGTLAYLPGPMFTEENRLTWLHPDGKTSPFNDEHFAFAGPELSSDGQRLSVILRGEVYRPYVYDIKSARGERVVIHGDIASCAIAPDGRQLAYSSNVSGPYSLYIRDLNTGEDRLVFKDPSKDHQVCFGWSADSKTVAFAMSSGVTSQHDIWVADVASGQVRAFISAPGDERWPRFSPSGRWLAYSSEQGGAREIHLKSFPDGAHNRQVTEGGGDKPIWSADGSKLYFVRDGKLLVVPFSQDEGRPAGKAQIIYDKEFGHTDYDGGEYTVTPDGRILLVEPTDRGPKIDQIVVILNWWRMLDGK